MNFWLPLRAHWRLKAGLLVVLTPLFCGPYLFLAHHALFPPRSLPLWPIDRWIGFSPTPWTVLYQSLYLITTFIPFMAITQEQLWRYVRGTTILSIVCFIFFLFCPVVGPIPAHWPAGGMYDGLRHFDGPYNAFPSLHAGFLAYSLAFGCRVIDRRYLRAVYAALIPWSVLILYATLATKQHYFVDLPAGVAMGLVADAWAGGWGARSARATLKMARSSGATSQLG
jgi:hypothetical protein